MKRIFAILALLLINSTEILAFQNSKMIKFELVEAKTNLPLEHQEIEVFYYQMIYDAPPKLDFIKTIKTDDKGNFELSKEMIGKREIGMKYGKNYKMGTVKISSDNKVRLIRFKNRFTHVLANTLYDLDSMIEINFNYYRDTVKTRFERIKLIAYDKESYWIELEKKITEYQTDFEADQESLWNFLWEGFVYSIDEEVRPPFNSGIWFKHIITCNQLFEFDLRSAYDKAKKIDDPNKLYYHLYSLCMIINGRKIKITESEKEIVKWIDNQIEIFYKKNPDLELNSRNDKLPWDQLSSTYKKMKEKV